MIPPKENLKMLAISAIASESECLIQLKNSYPGQLFVEPVGIGLVEAAYKIAEILCKTNMDYLLFVGSAGVQDGAEIEMGSVALPTEIQIVDYDKLRNHSYFPPPMETLFSTKPGDFISDSMLSEFPFSILSHGVAFNPLSITKSKDRVSMLQDLELSINPYYEQLEIAAIAFAAQKKGIPFLAILGISNYIGEDAHEQWLQNRKIAEENACNLTARVIQSLLSGNQEC